MGVDKRWISANRYDAFPAGIYVATLDGELKPSSFVPGPEFHVFEKPWYQDGIKSEKFIFGSVYFDEDSQSYVAGASGVLKDRSGRVAGLQSCVGENGEQIYLNLETVPDSSWTAVTYVPESEVMAGMNALPRNIIVIALVSVAVLFLAVLVLVRRRGFTWL